MSLANFVGLKQDSLTLEMENRQLAEHNQALSRTLRETNERNDKAMELLSQDIRDLEDDLTERTERMQALEHELAELRRRAVPPAPPAPPPPTALERQIARGLKKIVVGRAEESLDIFARMGGLSPSMDSFYQRLFHSWVAVGSRMDGRQFARRLVFGLKGKLHDRFLRAYCLALEELVKRPGVPVAKRRQWLLELAELHLEHPRQAMAYLLKARKAS